MKHTIKKASKKDIPALYGLYDQMGKKDAGYFEALFAKECIILMAFSLTSSSSSPTTSSSDLIGGSNEIAPDPSVKPKDDNKRAIGFGVLNFEPKYSLYKRLNIPEIQDLNVIPDMRQQGIATAMIYAFEGIAREKGLEHMGISVALGKAFGPAQRLYSKLGYIPDGNGVTYDRQPIKGGQAYYIDDDLCLMMVKNL